MQFLAPGNGHSGHEINIGHAGTGAALGRRRLCLSVYLYFA